MELPQSSRETARKGALAVPLTGLGDTIDEKTALAILEDLERSGSSIPEHVREQITDLTSEIGAKIGETIPPQILRGIIARAAIAGAAQAVSDTGASIADIEALKEALGMEPEQLPVLEV